LATCIEDRVVSGFLTDSGPITVVAIGGTRQAYDFFMDSKIGPEFAMLRVN
jgi:hypothetical protein